MSIPNIQEMLDAGVHFGHLTKRWNPKMRKYILTERNGIYVLDLDKTQACLQRAVEAVRRLRQQGRPVLFVGTKKTLKDCLKEEAMRCGQFYVTERWLGGMLTNFPTVRKSIKRLEEIEKMEAEGVFKDLSKKEVLGLNKEHAKLDGIFSGIRNMKTLPGALFVSDTEHEHIAVHEANRLNIPVAAIIDNGGPYSGSLQLRYFGPRPLTEDNSVRSDATTTVNGKLGYRVSKDTKIELIGFNLLDSKHSAIDYYSSSYTFGGTSNLSGRVFHPIESRNFRLMLITRY